MTIDQYTDTQNVLAGLMNGPLPMRKTAQVKDHAFADSARRLFPIDNELDAQLSVAYASCQWDELSSEVQEKIAAAATAWSVDVERLAVDALELWSAHTDKLTKTASAQADADVAREANRPFAYNEGGVRKFPLDTPEHTKLSSSSFGEWLHRLPLPARVKTASAILEAAGQQGLDMADMSQSVLTYAGACACDLSKLSAALSARERYAPHMAGQYLKLASHIGSVVEKQGLYESSPTELIDAASALVFLDAQAGLLESYGQGGIPDPYQSVFNTKMAISNEISLAGRKFPASSFAGMSQDELSAAVGPDFAEAMAPGGSFDQASFSQIASSVPMDLQVALANAVNKRA